MSALELKVYDLFKTRFNEEEARTVIEFIEAKAEQKYEQKKDILLTKDDKVDIISSTHRAIFLASAAQFLAIIAAMIAIFHFMMAK